MSTAIRKRQLGRPVSIVGAGMSRFGAFAGKDSRDLFVEAFQDMQDNLDQGIDVRDIECAYVCNYSSDLFGRNPVILQSLNEQGPSAEVPHVHHRELFAAD